MGLIATLIGLALSVWKTFFGKKDAPTQVEVANQIGRATADATRTSTAQLEKDLTDVQNQTADSAAAVRNAASLRNGQQIVSDAIERANADPSADR